MKVLNETKVIFFCADVVGNRRKSDVWCSCCLLVTKIKLFHVLVLMNVIFIIIEHFMI